MKRLVEFLLFLFVLTCCTQSVYADQKDHLFEQGNQFFQNGEYQKAVNSYNEILQMGYENAELYYNLANSYYKLGENARAILNYERALRLKPNDEDIRFNLQIANLSVVDKIPPLPELFYVRYFREFRSFFDVRLLTILSLIFYLLFIGTIILWFVNRSHSIGKIAKITAIVLILPLVLFSFTMISKIHAIQNNVEAVIITPNVDVRSAPSESGTEIFTIHSGLKVKITDNRDKWYEIQLPDGKEGWLQQQAVEII